MQTNPIAGVGLHAVGALSAASCYTPQKATKAWSWEVYWITQATFAWIILPIAGALITCPHYLDVLRACPAGVMLRSFLFGVVYGIGGLSFGLGIRYIGFSLNYAIAIGISAILGTLTPLIWHPDRGFVWEMGEKFCNPAGWIVLAGFLIAVAGIFICGWAGVMRERAGGQEPSQFSFKIGVPLAILAGVFSAIFYYALLSGGRLQELAVKKGAWEIISKNAVYPFSNGGAWVASFVFCMFLIFRNKTGGQFARLPGGSVGRLAFYYAMGILSGAFWYFQFFFYGMGEASIGPKYAFTGWILHMSLLILFSNIYGWMFREWEVGDRRPKRVLHIGMVTIIVATGIIGTGNYLGDKWAKQAEQNQPNAASMVSPPAAR